jgi:transient receptor potential cation channel subfamily M protein 2
MFIYVLLQAWELGLRDYYMDWWNRLDALLYATYVAGLFLRIASREENSDSIMRVAKIIFAINVIQLYLRLLRVYAVNSTLGPKLIMLRKMSSDMFTFLAFLAVFLVSYGIATQALLFPTETFGSQSAINVLYRPFFQIFGETFLDSLQEDAQCVGQWPFSACSPGGHLVPVLLAIFLVCVGEFFFVGSKTSCL